MNALLQFHNLSGVPGVVHGISDRKDVGNISFEFGKAEEVLRARGKLLGMMNEGNKGTKKLATLVSAKQTHSDHIFVHHEGGTLPIGEVEDTDAFISDARGVGFLIKTADCQAILMAGTGNAGQRVVAAVHAGWRGSLKNIAGKTVRKMVEEFDVDPATIEAGVGPSIGPCCALFEDESVLTKEAKRYRVLGASGSPTQRFDFWAMTRDQLMAESVREEAIEFCGICTVYHKDRWFSFRGDKPDFGRFGSVVGLD